MKLCCPYCFMGINEFKDTCDGITECTCGLVFKYENSIYYMFDKDKEHWIECKKEADGTVQQMKELDIYNFDPYSYTATYPYFENDENFSTNNNKLMFNYALFRTEKRRESVLVLGARVGWEANQFVEKEFKEVIAMDISDDEYVGLKYCNKLIEHTGNKFKLVCGDSAYLPFEDNSLEVVFVCASFHHFREKERAIKEIYRVLKHDGIFIAIGEPPRGVEVEAIEMEQRDAIHEWSKYNINEQQPTINDYHKFMSYFDEYEIIPTSEKPHRIAEDKIINGEHVKYLDIYNNMADKVKEKWNPEKKKMLNNWLLCQENTIMIGKKI